MEYTGFSEYLLKKWAKRGLPVLIGSGGNWTAHVDNIENFFRLVTRKQRQIQDDDNDDEGDFQESQE